MAALGSLVVKLALEFASYTQGLNRSEQDALKFGKSVQNAMDSARKATGDFLGSVVTGALGAVASYLTVATVVDRVGQAINRMDAIGKSAQQFGIPAAELEKLSHWAGMSDVSIEQLGTSTRKLGEALTKAATGGEKEAAMLKALGINAKGADGSVRGTADVLGDLAELFSQMPDGTTKTALAVKLLGEQGAALIPALNGGRKAMQDAGDEAKRFGLVTADAAKASAEAFNDNMTRLGKISEGVFNRLATQALPVLEAASTAFVRVADDISNTGDEASRLGSNRGVTEFLQNIVIGAATTVEALIGLAKTVRALGGSFEVVAADVQAAWAIARASPQEIGQAIMSGTGPLAAALAQRNKTVEEANARYSGLWNSNGAAVSEAIRAQFAAQAAAAGAGPGNADAEALKKQTAAAEAARKAAERRALAALAAANADTKASKAADQLAKATADYVGAVEHRLEVSAAELVLGRKQTDEEVALIDLRDRLAKGTIKLSDAERMRVEEMIRQTQANKEAVKALAEYNALVAAVSQHSSKMADAEVATTEQMRQQLVAMRERNDQLAMGEAVYSAHTAATMRAQAADLEWQAAMEGGNYQLEERARLLRAMADEESRGTALKAEADAVASAKAVADEWDRTADSIRGALTDALRRGFESGESFGRNLAKTLENELKTRVAAALADSLVSLGLSVIGGANGGSGAGGAGGMQIANTLASVYSAGAKAYAWYSGGSMAAGSTASQFVAGYQGSAGMMGAGTVGPVTNGAAGATGAGAAAGNSAAWLSTWGAAIAAGVWKANQDWNNGFRRDQAADVSGTAIGGFGTSPLGRIEPAMANFYSDIGFNDKLADALSGALAVAALAGYSSPKIRDAGITGRITGGDFTGMATANSVQEAGFLTKLVSDDKVTPLSKELPAELGKFLDAGAAGILDKAKAYGAALNLPVESLGSIAQEIKILADDQGQITQEALLSALGGYGDALVKGWEDAIKPLASFVDGRAETTAETLNRVGAALVSVNDMFEQMGITALQASVQGAAAAVSLQDLFGGAGNMQQELAGYYGAFFSEAERAARLQSQLTAEFAKYGATLPASREEFRALVDQVTSGRKLETAAAQEQFRALLGVAGAYDALMTAQEALAEQEADAARELADAAKEAADAAKEAADAILELQRNIREGLGAVIADFASGRELARFRADDIQSALGRGGINVSIEQILGSTRADIVALWLSVGDAGQAAILEAYGAWKDMSEAIESADIAAIVEPLGTTLDSLMAAYAELTPAADDLVASWRTTRDEVKALSDALAAIDGTQAVSALDALRNAVAKRDGLKNVLGGIDDRILSLRVGQGGSQAVDLLKQREAKLWAEFAGTNNPALAQAITDTTLQRIQLEGSLQDDANKTQIEALQEQIGAAERLRDIAKDMGQFVLSLKAGSLSNLSYTGRLSASRQLFEGAIANGGDVQGQAQAYLQQAQSVYGGSTGQYSAIFDEVTARLEGLGLTGGGADASIEDAQTQLDALLALGDTSDEQIAALGDLKVIFGTSLGTLDQAVRDLRAPLDAQLAELKLVQAAQERQIIQAGEAYTRLIGEQAAGRVTLDRIDRRTALRAAEPVV